MQTCTLCGREIMSLIGLCPYCKNMSAKNKAVSNAVIQISPSLVLSFVLCSAAAFLVGAAVTTIAEGIYLYLLPPLSDSVLLWLVWFPYWVVQLMPVMLVNGKIVDFRHNPNWPDEKFGLLLLVSTGLGVTTAIMVFGGELVRQLADSYPVP